MICDYVSRKEIKALKVGQIGIFTLPTKKAKDSARVQFSKVKELEEGKFDCERVDEPELRNILGNDFEKVIPNMSMTVAYRCTKNEIEQ